MVSIIVTCWNKTQFMAACGMACIASIRAFTDPKDYELIVIETLGTPLWDGHGTLGLKELKDKGTYIQRNMETEDQGNSADMNQGAKLAKGDYLVFIENDVILHEHWLPDMMYYFEHNLTDALTPCQYFSTWENTQKWKKMTFEEGMNNGLEEAGMLMIRKDTFKKSGGWNERIKKVYMWKAFLHRLSKAGFEVKTTYKVAISHIGGVAYWWEEYNNKVAFDKVTEEEIRIMKEEGI